MGQKWVKVSLRFGILTICANGANDDPLAPMVMDLMAQMVHLIAMSANDDRHWRQFKWFHWHHFVAKWCQRDHSNITPAQHQKDEEI